MHLHRPDSSPKYPQGQGFIDMLPSLVFQALRPKPPEYPTELLTLGDHIKARRLDLGLDQTEAATQLGVGPVTVLNWEKHHTVPHVRAYPAIMDFLGYCPIQYPKSVGERIRLHRIHRGLTILDLANILGADVSTVGNWERGLNCPLRQSGSFLKKIDSLPHYSNCLDN